ncbi:MAG: hypothetical protein J6D46_02010 [Lachnospiraceae bacterium]|nr:hypothetical protein [Lachnospiraceae bacterium]
MGAVYKKELRSSFTTMTGPVAIAVMLFIGGYMFRTYNLANGLSSVIYAVFTSSLIFYFVVPILSMRVFAEERRLRTDQLLFTAPVRLIGIILGKYFALVTVFAIPVLVLGTMPVVMRALGGSTMRLDYAGILVFFLMGCAYLSVGMFISTLTENLIVSAIMNILLVAVTMMIHNAYSMISGTVFTSMIFFVILSVLIGIAVYAMTGFYWLSVGVLTVLAAVSLVLSYMESEFITGSAEKILGILDFYSHFETFVYETFRLTDLVYFISAAVVGIVLTHTSIIRRRWN